MRKKFILSLTVCYIFLTIAAPAHAQSNDKFAQLTAQIDKIVHSYPLSKAKSGIKIVSLSDGKQIYSHQADQPMAPASNMKIVTAATALSQLGVLYRFKTVIYADGPINKDGQLEGNLYIKGFGDPLLVWEELTKIARYIQGMGLRQIKGDVIADDSFFDSKRVCDGWRKEDSSRWYEAPLGALSVNFNTVEINIAPGLAKGNPLNVWINPATSYFKLENKSTTGGKGQNLDLDYLRIKGEPALVVKGRMPSGCPPQTFFRTIDDPPAYAAGSFKSLLELWGVKINGQSRTGTVPASARELYVHQSKQLPVILRGLNKFSNNFTAEQLIKTIGAEKKGAPGTTESGLQVVTEFLQSLNIDTSKITLLDGSGLSRENRITANLLADLLTAVYRNFEWQPEFMGSLPLAGGDGTLHKRMKDNGTCMHVRAKTGRIFKASALSGYVITKDNETWAFSMLMNDFDSSVEDMQQQQDKICRLLANFSKN